MSEVITEKTRKITSLQSLRAVAFLCIITSHIGLSRLGAWGVSVFLILSGFVMFYSYRFKELDSNFIGNLKFAVGKISRLYPLHILMMILALLFMVVGLWKNFSVNSLLLDIFEIFLNLTLLQSFIPNEDIYFSLNSVSWYLSVSFVLYALFPIFLKKVSDCKSLKNAVINICFVFFLQIFFAFLSNLFSLDFQKWFTYINPFFRLGDFLIGMYLSYIYIYI